MQEFIVGLTVYSVRNVVLFGNIAVACVIKLTFWAVFSAERNDCSLRASACQLVIVFS